ncbi:uncharacterized protein TRAVEDRAFT_134054 [Trametes versicolor FP-101664 SS1]|uniref:uncharacterized protein n=1 Tax=Trametes versicolor (strain FP-101664) TaxID=717944 RepID=UPI0004622AD4|nr:uncharacterized protein TRAVEDRAFT_134054 [Trametes versicolor FP-101664 SS1]EIW53242.1 hypothetical protein TRAVEDRAFT_134054 [Trametes versicolor FP-101664 SS1]
MDAGLPQYERSPLARSSTSSASRGVRPPTEHLYHRFTSSKGQPWLTLKVASKAPASSYLPAFYQGEAITGSVVLCLDREETIKSVSVQLFGQMTSSTTDVLNFLQISQVLWPPSSSSALQNSSQSTANPGKLSGEHSWPFSLTLPESCLLKSPNGLDQSYSLPASFSERMARVHIQYQIVVTVHRSRFRVDSTLGTVVGYCPKIQPGAPSLARQIAYLENSPLIGPDGDPDGWQLLEPLRINGSVFSTRSVEATCTLALAKPLCYTRGSVIPCLMTIETTDPQALDLLSAPRSPVVRLLRRISTPDTTAGSAGTKTLPGLEFESSSQEVTAAVWWSEHARDPRSPQRRVLHGEIHLSPGLKPTSRLGKFELSVSVTPPSLRYLLPTLHACLVLGRRLPSEGGRIPARWRRGGGAPERMRGHWHRLRRWAQAENPLPSWIR